MRSLGSGISDPDLSPGTLQVPAAGGGGLEFRGDMLQPQSHLAAEIGAGA